MRWRRRTRWVRDPDLVLSEDLGVSVVVDGSAGSDGACVVFIDTDFEPDGSDGGPGLRVSLNDTDLYVGVEYRPEL